MNAYICPADGFVLIRKRKVGDKDAVNGTIINLAASVNGSPSYMLLCFSLFLSVMDLLVDVNAHCLLIVCSVN